MRWLSLIFQALPSLIVAVEQIIGAVNSRNGPEKKAAVIGLSHTLATSVAQITKEKAPEISQVAEAAGPAIDATVEVLNAAGVFKTAPR